MSTYSCFNEECEYDDNGKRIKILKGKYEATFGKSYYVDESQPLRTVTLRLIEADGKKLSLDESLKVENTHFLRCEEFQEWLRQGNVTEC